MKIYQISLILLISLLLSFKTACQSKIETIENIESLIIEYKVPTGENSIIFKKIGSELSKDDACTNGKTIASRFTFYKDKLRDINTDIPNSLISEYKKVKDTSLEIFKIIDDNLKGSTCVSHSNPNSTGYYKLNKTDSKTLYLIADIVRFNTNLRLLQTICYQLILNEEVKEIKENLSRSIEAYKADSVKIYKRINNLDSITNTKLSTKKFNDTIKNYLKTNQFDSLFDSKIKSYLGHFPKPSIIDTAAIYKFINNKDRYTQSQIKILKDTIVKNKNSFKTQLESKASIDSVNSIIPNYRKNYFKEDFRKEAKKKWWIPALLFANTLTTLLLLLSKN